MQQPISEVTICPYYSTQRCTHKSKTIIHKTIHKDNNISSNTNDSKNNTDTENQGQHQTQKGRRERGKRQRKREVEAEIATTTTESTERRQKLRRHLFILQSTSRQVMPFMRHGTHAGPDQNHCPNRQYTAQHQQCGTKITARHSGTCTTPAVWHQNHCLTHWYTAQLQQCGTKITARLCGTPQNSSCVAPKSLPDSVVHHTTPAVWYQNHCPTQWYTAQYQQCHTYSHSKTASDLTINHVHSWY